MDAGQNHPAAAKEMRKTTVSVIVPTFNSDRTIQACLESIRLQSYPSTLTELIVADAGSKDRTLEIAQEFNVDRIVDNPLKTGEAGKTEGIKASSGEIIALIDSDNILDDHDWLSNMLEPFSDPDIIAAEPIRFTWRRADPAMSRYFALLGMSDPVCLFLGNYDRYCMLTGKWTGLDVSAEDRGPYYKLTLRADQLPTLGANGLVFRRSLLDHISWDPYFFDIDVMYQAALAGCRHTAKVKCGIVHLYCDRLADFARKQDRRIRDFFFYWQEGKKTYPWNRQRRLGFVRFCVYSLLVFPLIIQMLRGWWRKRDAAWLYHLPVCWITLWVYWKAVLSKALGIRPEPKSRERWQQPSS